MHVSLTKKLESMVRSKVESGLYNNASEVVREALRMMHYSDEAERLRYLDFKHQAVRGFEQGEGREFATRSFDEIEKAIEAKNNVS
ncbi:MAG: type II toxin-antitoxin system ParD family antitoxin [Verrucomicrobia bacterium]|nr:type II toxin-antitoxin system ParD family antitoxin [Verrucomicrobiota bacterium]